MVEEVLTKSKEKFYRGKNLDDVKDLDVREFTKHLPSRARRYVLRNFDVVEKFIKRCERKLAKKKKIKTHQRDMVIVPKLIGMEIGVYNGKSFENVIITHEMIGHKLGEFSLSRRRTSHGKAGLGATKSSKTTKK
jgi:small subunit ribosomal protein S19